MSESLFLPSTASSEAAPCLPSALPVNPSLPFPSSRNCEGALLQAVTQKSKYLAELAATQAAMDGKRECQIKDIHRLPKALRVVLNPERKQRQALKRRKPGQWLALVKSIDKPDLRQRVACIVWWDYFASRPHDARWAHLDRWVQLDLVPYVPLEEIRLALYGIGYTALQAHSRVHESYYSVNGRIYKTHDDDN